MTEFDMVAYKKGTNDVVAIGSTIYSNAGECAELLKLTRVQTLGKSGKVRVRWIDSWDTRIREYYDHVFGLDVRLKESEMRSNAAD